MLEPDSQLLVWLLILASAVLLAVGGWLRQLPVKIACGVLAIIVAMAGGVAVVNDYYGSYRTWGALRADFSGNVGNLGVVGPVNATPAGSGRIAWIDLPGRLSGYDRRGLVYLPPQYGQPRYAHVRFPVVEAFHGTPGTPLAWDTVLQVNQIADQLLARHLMGPMVLVMPAINGKGRDFQDCVDGPGVHDDTYLTQDVRADVLARYRVAAAVLEGYFRAADGPARIALRGSKILQAASSPLYLAENLQPGSGPVPAFWVAAGTRDGSGYRLGRAFAAALDRIEQSGESAPEGGCSGWAR